MGMVWVDKFKVGFSEFDEHRRQIFVLMDEIIKGVEKGKPAEKVAGYLDNLIRVVDFHLRAEESKLLSDSYPNFKEHLNSHSFLICSLLDIVSVYKGGKISNGSDMRGRFENSLVAHIVKMDKKYADFFQVEK